MQHNETLEAITKKKIRTQNTEFCCYCIANKINSTEPNEPFVRNIKISAVFINTQKYSNTYLRICVIINCDVCLQASTQDRRTFRTFSRNSGQSFD